MCTISYRRHRFPASIIRHAVWLYLRFTLSYRDVEELLAERGLELSYESVRSWVLKFEPVIARNLRRCRPRPGDRWHLDEMVVRIAGKHMYLWRAVDHEGEVLDMLVQRRRDKRAALRLMRKLLRKQGFAPKRVTTDQLRSYGAAFQHLGLSCHHEQGLRQNNRAENSHQAVRLARTQDATLQITGIGSALPEYACRRPQHLQPSAPSRLPFDASDVPIRGGRAMAQRDDRGMMPSLGRPPFRPPRLNLTVPGDVLTVEFSVAGIPCLGLNGGPAFRHNEAFSFQIATDDQQETDRYWNAIVGNGGQESERTNGASPGKSRHAC